MMTNLSDMLEMVNRYEKFDGKPHDNYLITQLLQEHDYTKGCTFKAGDWVTPKPTSNKRRPGEPCLVISAFDCCQYQIIHQGAPLVIYNMIIARPGFVDDITDIHLYVVDSSDYELYKGLVYGDGGENNISA